MSGVDVTALDQVSASEVPFEFQVKDATGNPMTSLDDQGNPVPFCLQVLGDDAERVHKFMTRKVNEDRRNQKLRLHKGKVDEYTPIENDIEYSIDACIVRTVGWTGTKQAYSEELARTMFRRNKHIRAQVMEESANAANFPQRKASS